MRANKASPPSTQEINQLSGKFKELQAECTGLHGELSDTSTDLDERIAYLDKFLKRGGDLKDLFKNYQKLA